MGNTPTQMNIQSMYSDSDLDANGMETEFQAAFDDLIWFVNQDFANTGRGDYDGEEVTIVRKEEDGRFYVETDKGTRFMTKTVFIAAGVGSFQPKRLSVPGIEKFEGTQLHYQVKDPELFYGKNIVICGGGDSALDWTLNLVGKAESVILLHRRDGFRAQSASVAKMRELCENWEMQFEVGQVTGFEEKDGKLTEIRVTGDDGVVRRMPLDHLLVFFGLTPKLGPIADWGLEIYRKQIVVDTEKFQTSIPGIFAVGDINTYAGKKKLILCGFHECALAAFAAADIVHPEKKTLLQYTTTSPKLHKVLGVETPTLD